MRGTFLESESFSANPNVDFCFVGIAYCSASYLNGVEEASSSIRKLSYRYANADGTSSPLKIYSPEEGYVLKNALIADAGTIKARSREELEEALKLISIPENVIPIFCGGDHSVTYELVKKVCDDELVLVQFDAHSDYIDEYDEYPHGSVMCECKKLKNVKKIIHFGIRGNLNSEPAISKSEKDGNLVVPYYCGINHRFKEVIEEIKGKKIYITFDTDFLNPSIAPATNCPEPGGPLYDETLSYLKKIIRSAGKVIGADFVEYNPSCEGSMVTGITLVNIIIELLSYIKNKEGEEYP